MYYLYTFKTNITKTIQRIDSWYLFLLSTFVDFPGFSLAAGRASSGVARNAAVSYPSFVCFKYEFVCIDFINTVVYFKVSESISKFHCICFFFLIMIYMFREKQRSFKGQKLFWLRTWSDCLLLQGCEYQDSKNICSTMGWLDSAEHGRNILQLIQIPSRRYTSIV